MKKYTENDLKSFEVVNGYLICPTGDYTEIKSFDMKCSFGERCSFGESCSFGEQCSFGQEYIIENNVHLLKFLKFEGFGREKRCTYFFLDTDKNIFVRCGCFFGNLEKFKEEVKKTHSDNKFGVGYLKVADLAEWQLLN